MKKRIISLLLVLAMLFTLMPEIGISASADAAVAEVNGTGYDTVQGAISVASDQTVKLLNDVTENITVESGKTVTLDLNDKVLKPKDADTQTIIVNGTLTLTDSAATKTTKYFSVDANGLWTPTDSETANSIEGGVITGATKKAAITVNGDSFTMIGGTIAGNNMQLSGAGVYVCNSGAFTMEGGSIMHNSAAYGGGVFVTDNAAVNMTGGRICNNIAVEFSKNNGGAGGGVYVKKSGSFTMTGGSVTGNKADVYAGGVCFENGSITLGGTADITGSTAGTVAYTSNLFIPADKTVTVGTAPVAKDKNDPTKPYMLVGVTLENGIGTVTSANSADYKQHFTSDNSLYGVINEVGTGAAPNQVVKLVHVCSWTYKDHAADENVAADTLTATCANTDGKHSGDTTETLTIVAPTSLTYDNTAKAASIKDNKTSLGGISVLTIQYQKKNGETWGTAVTTAPKAAGTYKASITLDTDKTAYVEYTINKATPTSYTAPTDLTATDGQTLADVTLPKGFTWADANTTSVGAVGENSFKVNYNPDPDNYNTVEGIDVTIEVQTVGSLKMTVSGDTSVCLSDVKTYTVKLEGNRPSGTTVVWDITGDTYEYVGSHIGTDSVTIICKDTGTLNIRATLVDLLDRPVKNADGEIVQANLKVTVKAEAGNIIKAIVSAAKIVVKALSKWFGR